MLHKIVNRVKWRIEALYSFYKSKEFKSVGSDFRCCYPLHLHNGRLIVIGAGFRSNKRLRLEAFLRGGEFADSKIVIGNNVHITWDCHIGAMNRVEIHDNVLIGSKVLITDHMHGRIDAEALSLSPDERPLWSKGPVVIEENVWIGEGVSILPNVTIGKNAIIGTNAVVTSDVPANSVVAGIPAKVIKVL